MAAKEGLNPLDRQFWDRYSYHKANPTDANLRGAAHDAYAGTFMEDLGPGTKRFTSALSATPLKWVLPFMHIPLNIARQTIRYTPAAFLGPEMRAAIMGERGVPAQDLAIAKMVVGTLLVSYFVYQGLKDEATGAYPTNQKERNEWRLMGKIPNAVQAGGEWHQMERFWASR